MSSTDVHGHAAGAEDLGRHVVDVVAAVDRVAGDQRDGGAAVRQDGLAAARCSPPARRGRSAGAASRCGRDAWSGRCRASSAAGRGSPAPPCSPRRFAARPVLRRVERLAPRCRSGCCGLALPPSPACTSARQRPRASSKSDSGSGTGFEAPPVLARLAIAYLPIAAPAFSSGALVLSVESVGLCLRMARPPG